LKLSPTNEFKEFNQNTSTYYYNTTNGKLTKPNADGNYDPNAQVVRITALQNAIQETLPTGTNCFSNIITKFDQNGWIAKAYNEAENAHGAVTRIANEADDTTELQTSGIKNINIKLIEDKITLRTFAVYTSELPIILKNVPMVNGYPYA
jgi:hypothetical protein